MKLPRRQFCTWPRALPPFRPCRVSMDAKLSDATGALDRGLCAGWLADIQHA